MTKEEAQIWSQRMTEVMQQAIAEEIERRRKLGYPIAIWKDGKVVVGKVEDIIPNYRYKYQKEEAH